MPTLPDRTYAVLGLCSRLVDTGDVSPLKAREYWDLADRVGDVSTLVGASVGDLTARGVDAGEAERCVRLLDRAGGLALALEELGNVGVWTVVDGDEGYPEGLRRLDRQAPPLLHGAGPLSLVDRPTLGIVGSRNVDESGAEVARDAAREAVSRGWTVVSGGARGVDQLAMAAALDAGGETVGALAESLLKRLRDSDARRAVHDERLCLLTPYKPDAGFSVANAMGRNKLIYALANLTLVVATDADTGGTWAGATEALRRHFGDVAVWSGAGEGPGNGALAAKGARSTSEVEDLFVERVGVSDPERVDQLDLGF